MAIKEPMIISLKFKKSIRTDGEITTVTIKQAEQEIQLTQEQAISLSEQLQSRFGKK